MERGILLQKTFNLKSSSLQTELDAFTRQLSERMKQFQVPEYVGLRRMKSEDLMEIIVIPCKEGLQGQAETQAHLAELQNEGFEAANFQNAQDVGRYATAPMEPLGIQFGQ
jgi:hypothetical protein